MYGVVLMGGKSSRMGTDKAFLTWNGVPLYQNCAAVLGEVFEKVFLSVNTRQVNSFSTVYPLIVDEYLEEGPAGALVSSHRHLGSSIFFLGCDLPLVTPDDIKFLVQHFAKNKNCSMYYNAERSCYEAVCSAWSATMLKELEAYYNTGSRSLQQFLDLHKTEKLIPEDLKMLINVNNPMEYDLLLKRSVIG